MRLLLKKNRVYIAIYFPEILRGNYTSDASMNLEIF
jgi:hypothetical protein